MAVGRVLECYDTDRRFPVWGFGAALPPSGAVSHCFSLGGTPQNPEVDGIQGILGAYRQAGGKALHKGERLCCEGLARQRARLATVEGCKHDWLLWVVCRRLLLCWEQRRMRGTGKGGCRGLHKTVGGVFSQCCC